MLATFYDSRAAGCSTNYYPHTRCPEELDTVLKTPTRDLSGEPLTSGWELKTLPVFWRCSTERAEAMYIISHMTCEYRTYSNFISVIMVSVTFYPPQLIDFQSLNWAFSGPFGCAPRSRAMHARAHAEVAGEWRTLACRALGRSPERQLKRKPIHL